MNKIKNKIRKFWYHYIFWPTYDFFKYKFPIFINTLNIFRIYSDWWSARKHFRRPVLKIYKMKVGEENNYLGDD